MSDSVWASAAKYLDAGDVAHLPGGLPSSALVSFSNGLFGDFSKRVLQL